MWQGNEDFYIIFGFGHFEAQNTFPGLSTAFLKHCNWYIKHVVTETHFAFCYSKRSNKGKYLPMETVGTAPWERSLLLQMQNVQILTLSITMRYALFT